MNKFYKDNFSETKRFNKYKLKTVIWRLEHNFFLGLDGYSMRTTQRICVGYVPCV